MPIQDGDGEAYTSDGKDYFQNKSGRSNMIWADGDNEKRERSEICKKCKGEIGLTDVEGQYSGECAHCRGNE